MAFTSYDAHRLQRLERRWNTAKARSKDTLQAIQALIDAVQEAHEYAHDMLTDDQLASSSVYEAENIAHLSDFLLNTAHTLKHRTQDFLDAEVYK